MLNVVGVRTCASLPRQAAPSVVASMSSATDTCPGCGRSFAPGGYANHLRLSHDPRCGSLRNGLVYRYTGSPVNLPVGSQPAPRFTTPDPSILDVSGEEPDQGVTDMSIDDEDGCDENIENTGHSTTDIEDDDENFGSGDGAGDIN